MSLNRSQASEIPLWLSPCPNDTFMFFHALESKWHSRKLIPHFHDIAQLNQALLDGQEAILKASFYAWYQVKDKYLMSSTGAAMGYNCGPLLVSRKSSLSSLKTIAVPGESTTAYLLLNLFLEHDVQKTILPFDQILKGVADRKFDAGLIIHESRFTYPQYGLQSLVDLGKWWHQKSNGLPLPLGAIFIPHSLADEVASFAAYLKYSIRWAQENREKALRFCRQYAQEMDTQVMDEHIKLYVNDYSLSLNNEAKDAISMLESLARDRELL